MRTISIFLLTILTALPATATTRQEAIVAMVSLAETQYQSAATGTDELQGNLFHPNYSNGSPAHSPWWFSGWPGYPDTDNPLGGIWTGFPFMLGGDGVSTCQSDLYAGNGLSATTSHLIGNGQNVSWASGADCAACIGWASGIGSSANTWTLVDPGYSNPIEWADLRQADWLVFRPADGYGDSRMFSKWDSEPTSCTYVYSSFVQGVVSIVLNADVQTLISDGYNPYEPNHYAGETAAAVDYFSAKMNGVMTLSWETTRERDTYFFRVERALTRDGPRTLIAELSAQGSATTGSSYQVTDPGYSGGPVWYFLVEIEETLGEFDMQRVQVLGQ